MARQRFSESHGIVPCVIPVLDNFNAGDVGDSINMAKYNHLTLILIGNADCAGTPVLTIYGGATVGAQTTALTFSYRYSSADAEAAALADVYGTFATSAALTLVAASIAAGVLVCEIEAANMVSGATQYQWITPVLDAAGTDGEFAMIGILSEPRYAQAVMPSATV